MLTSNKLSTLLHGLENGNEEVAILIEKIIQIVVELIKNESQLSEELGELAGHYHFQIIDANFNFWIKIIDEKVTYHKRPIKSPIVSLSLTKEMFAKIVQNEISPAEAYFKGDVKLKGSLSQTIKLRFFYSLLKEYFPQKKLV